VDTEFTKKEDVSLQVSFYHNHQLLEKWIVFNTKLVDDELEEKLISICEKDEISCFFHEFHDDTSILHRLVSGLIRRNFPEEEFSDTNFLVNLLFFYSPKDIEYSFGFNRIKQFFKKKQPKKNTPFIIQDRAIRGSFPIHREKYPFKVRYRLRDLKGYTNLSLKALANSLSIEMNAKNELDAYKTNMDFALRLKPELFVKYAIDDSLVLYQIFEKSIEILNNLLSECLELPKFYAYNLETMKYSNGSLVSDIFIKYLNYWTIKKIKKQVILKINYWYQYWYQHHSISGTTLVPGISL
jgi:hypothetical protein